MQISISPKPFKYLLIEYLDLPGNQVRVLGLGCLAFKHLHFGCKEWGSGSRVVVSRAALV